MSKLLNISFFLTSAFNLVFGSSAFAQLINANAHLFSDEPFFNEKFIAQNKIRSVKGKLASKKEMDIIRRSFTEDYYEFDQQGKQLAFYNTFYKQDRQKDTTMVLFTYNTNDNLIVKRKCDHYGFFSYHYTLDDTGRIIASKYCRDENTGPNKRLFTLGTQFVIAEEEFRYEKLNGNTEKKVSLNNYGRAFKEDVISYDEFGWVSSIASRYLIGNNYSKVSYEYNENGRISSKTTISGSGKDQKILKETYTYDEIGNLLEMNVYKNDEHVTVKQVLYDGRMLMSALLTKEVATNLIHIVEYDYTFYGEEAKTPPLPLDSAQSKSLE